MRNYRFAFCLVFLSMPVGVQADVVLDGSAGTTGVLIGPNFNINENMGVVVNQNLFHSFSEFSVEALETATFSGNAGIENIISRVTGNSVSNIDGTIRSTIAGADFWFFNPNGIVLGEQATLDLSGSLYLGSASSLVFSDGSTYTLETDPQAAQLAISPMGFGFTGSNNQGVAVKSTVALNANENFGIAGSQVVLVQADVDVRNGAFKAYAVNEGDIVFSAMPTTNVLDGTLSINNTSLSVSGNENVAVNLAGAQVNITNNSDIQLANTGDQVTGEVYILGGDVVIDNATLNLENSGDGATIGLTITGNSLAVSNEGSL